MAGAYALAFASQWDLAARGSGSSSASASCSRSRSRWTCSSSGRCATQSPAVMLVATFAVAFLLQSIALLAFGPLGKIAVVARAAQPPGDDLRRRHPQDRDRLDRRRGRSASCSCSCCSTRTAVGLQMRAASMDFRTARLLGVRANRVIGGAVLVSGVLAAVVAVMLTVQNPLVHAATSRCATRSSCSPASCSAASTGSIPATLGGFAIGFASGLLGGALPTNQSQYLPTFLFARRHPRAARPPERPLHAQRSRRSAYEAARTGSCSSRRRSLLVVAAALVGTLVSQSSEGYFVDALVKVVDRRRALRLHRQLGRALVRARQLRRGRRVDRPACSSVPVSEKPAIMPNLAGFLRDRTVGTVPSLALAALVGGVFALVVGLPLMRLSGLAAGIATFAVLGITHNVLRYYEKIGPGLNTFSSVPETTGLWQAALGALIAIVVAFAYQRSRFGRHAARDARGSGRRVAPSASRSTASAWSRSSLSRRARRASRAASTCTCCRSTPSRVYLDLTFVTLAMLVVGGVDEPLGRGRRRARGQRARLVPRRRRERRLAPRRHARPAGGHAARRRRRADGARPHPPPVRAHRRPRVPGSDGCAADAASASPAPATIGSLLAAHLAQVADVSVLTRREEHARALNEQGLRVSGRADFTGARRRRPTDPAELPDAELVILACKGTDLEPLARAPRRALRRRDGDDGAERPRRRGDRRRARRLAAALRGHVHERHAARRHARRVHPRHGDLDRAVPRHDAGRRARASPT